MIAVICIGRLSCNCGGIGCPNGYPQMLVPAAVIEHLLADPIKEAPKRYDYRQHEKRRRR